MIFTIVESCQFGIVIKPLNPDDTWEYSHIISNAFPESGLRIACYDGYENAIEIPNWPLIHNLT